MQEIWIATGNKGKLSEMKILLEKEFPGISIKSIADLPVYSAPPENGKTFLDNARIKAKSLKAMKPGVWVLAEDSGLEVEALNNLPGVHSAVYAGPKARDSENVAKLLKMLQIRPAANRNAKFVCTMVVFSPEGEEIIYTGEMKGTISSKVMGMTGFGYDPVFIPEGQSKTLAELGIAFKNMNSHRAQALKQFIQRFK
jgi:XTP/dITP diphosphohydrolase